MDQVRIGLINTSWWADSFLLPTLCSHEGAVVAAICGRNQERAAEMADKYNVPKIYSDYRQLIDEGELDGLVVASPDDLHYEMTMYALEAGLHVLCEKPLANNAADARQMYDKAEAAGLKHMVLYTWRWLPQMQYIKDLLDDGYLGRAYQAHFRFAGSAWHKRDYVWRADADRANGILGDLGSHMIDLARWMLGDVASVSASLRTHIERDSADGGPLNPANDSAFVLLDLASGAQVVVEVSAVNHMAKEWRISVSLYGEKGTLHTNCFAEIFSPIVRGAKRDEDAIELLDIPLEYLHGVVEGDIVASYRTKSIGPRLFIDSLLADRSVEPNFYDGYKNQLVIDAALESQAQGRRIAIPQA